MSEITKEQIVLEAKRTLYRRSLYEFFKAAAPILEPSVAWDFSPFFYKYLCDLLQSEVQRIIDKKPKTHNLICNLPFRSGKSTLISQVLPVWCWVLDPSFKLITISSNQALANRLSEKSLNFIHSQWFQELFGKDFKLVNDAISDYRTNKSGHRISFGMSSKDILGSGANMVILDDPQSIEDLSSTGIDLTVNKFTDKIYSRLNDPKVDIHILVQQRLHQQDLSGYLLDNNDDNEYLSISIPAKVNDAIQPPELVDYYHDGYLWPNRFDEKELRKYKKTLGSRMFASQLMMKPHDDEGTLIKTKWFDVIESKEVLTEIVGMNGTLPAPHFVLDTAQTADKTKKNDPTALMSFYKINSRIYVFNVQTIWVNPADLNLWVATQVRANGYKAGSIINVESASSGPSLITYLKNNALRVVDLGKPTKDKVFRANQCLPEWEGGRVAFVNGSYLPSFKDEIAGFPNSAPHDDRVDCLIHVTEKFIIRNSKLNYAHL